ncbi:MAG: hypothetical protein QM709_11180 [Spongiibacteraceae bacterium]
MSTVVSIAAPAKPENNAQILRCPITSAFNVAAPPAQSSGQIVGRITYDRIPFKFPSGPTPGGPGLDYNNPQVLPVRGAVVEAIAAGANDQCDGAAVATALTDGDGWYRLASGNTKVCVRVRAQMYRAADNSSAASWNFAVADNTSANSLYGMIEASPATADAQPRRDLHAQSGWSGSSYNATREAAPFAILDTACQTMNAVLDYNGAQSFGSLTFMWSTKNTNDTSGTREQGKIGGAFFDANQRAIYLRGDAAVDTDEFDKMVIAHEFGHFAVHVLSRSDSIGGDHSLLDYLDPRLAFDEGWATAFAGLAMNDSIYRDSYEAVSLNSLPREYSFDIQAQYGNTPTGWYSEMSVQRALYKLGADISDGGVGMGLSSLLQTFSGSYKQTQSLASIFSYGTFLKSEQASYAGDIADFLDDENIEGNSITEFADNETHAESNFDLPVYAVLDTLGSKQTVCSSDAYGTENTLSNRRYLRFTPPQSARFKFNVKPFGSGVAGVEVIDRGSKILYQQGSTAGATLVANSDTLQGGRSYVLSIFHIGNVIAGSNVGAADKCFQVWAQAY